MCLTLESSSIAAVTTACCLNNQVNSQQSCQQSASASHIPLGMAAAKAKKPLNPLQRVTVSTTTAACQRQQHETITGGLASAPKEHTRASDAPAQKTTVYSFSCSHSQNVTGFGLYGVYLTFTAMLELHLGPYDSCRALANCRVSVWRPCTPGATQQAQYNHKAHQQHTQKHFVSIRSGHTRE